MTWREAMRNALYGPGGFYTRGEPPSRHYRTSAHVSSAYAGAMLILLREVDAALGHPDRLDVVDVGAGRGELLGQLLDQAGHDRGLAGRIPARTGSTRASAGRHRRPPQSPGW
jgi:SAM-dependent MidA family methyltransferase